MSVFIVHSGVTAGNTAQTALMSGTVVRSVNHSSFSVNHSPVNQQSVWDRLPISHVGSPKEFPKVYMNRI